MKKERTKAKKYANKGITLIALVITIIVLLILAGVSIAMLTGENGVLTKASEAKEETNREGAREKLNLILNGLQADKIPKGEKLELGDELASEIAAFDEVTSATYTGAVIEVVIDGYTFEVNADIGIDDKKEIAKVEPEDINDWEVDYETYPGYARLISYKGNDTEVVIPNYINGYWVKAIGKKETGIYDQSLWNESICTSHQDPYNRLTQDTITSIKISEGIEIIEEDAFKMTTNLQSLELPSTIIEIGNNAFSISGKSGLYDNKLTNVYLGKNIKTIGYDVFSRREGITINVEYLQSEIPEAIYDGNDNLVSGWSEEWNEYIEDITIEYGISK